MLVQLTDPHIGAEWDVEREAAAMLGRAVDAVRALPAAPAAVLVTGDLTDHGAAPEYELAQRLLEPLAVPIHVLPGNHDDRAELRRCFGLPGAAAEPVHYATEAAGLRIVVLDTSVPGSDAGDLDAGQLAWLDETLAAERDAPTLIALHHPPLLLGAPALDEIGLARAAAAALGDVVAAHPQVLRLLAGHVHGATAGELAGRPVVTAPSTFMQIQLVPGVAEIELIDAPGGYMLHVPHERGITSLARSF